LVERDAELLASLQREAGCEVTISIPFMDTDDARAIEPYVPTPRRRLRTIRTLAEAGVPVGVAIAPIIPGLTDEAIPAILKAAHQAGAQWADHVLLRLSPMVREVFEARLRAAFPMRADRVLGQLEACRGGRVEESRFGHRMCGQGDRWDIIARLFATTCARLGFRGRPIPRDPTTFRRPAKVDTNQLRLL
jgi:DNA repair photolyase